MKINKIIAKHWIKREITFWIKFNFNEYFELKIVKKLMDEKSIYFYNI